MKKSFTILLFACLGWLTESHACSCVAVKTFCESMALATTGQPTDNWGVYLGTVSATTETGIELLVEQTYFGVANTWQTITLRSGSGADCLVNLSNFNIGEMFIISTHKREDNIWQLSECGVSYLKVINGTVTGAIAPGVTSVSLAAFTSVANCGDLEGGIPLKVNPTLTSSEVNITTELQSQVPISVNVFDAAGRLVHQAKEPAFGLNKPLVLDMQAWAAGVYFVRIDLLSQRKTVRVVKVGG